MSQAKSRMKAASHGKPWKVESSQRLDFFHAQTKTLFFISKKALERSKFIRIL